MSAPAQIEALKASPVATGLMAVADDHPDAVLVKAWNKRQQAIADMETRGRFYSADDHSPAESELFDVCENAIPLLMAQSPQGTLAKLWIALGAVGDPIRNEEERAQSDAIRRADFDEVATFAEDFDFGPKVIWSLICDLTNALRFERVYPGRV